MAIKDTIYNKALGMLNINYSQIKDNEETPIEIKHCDDNISTSCYSAMSSRDYFWLMSSYTFTDPIFDWRDKTTKEKVTVTDDTTEEELAGYYKDYHSYHGFPRGYKVPSDMFKPFLVEGKYNAGFARKADEIYFADENLTLDYSVDVTKKMDDETWWANIPVPFIDLIACLLAINIAPMVAPEGTFGQNAATKMQTALAACIELNKDATREYRPNPKEYLQ